jgi:hypothetical protein
MAGDYSTEKQQLHRLIDNLPPDQLSAALSYLNFLCADPVLLSLLNAPPDDEPYTEEQRREDAEADATIARGEGIPHEEVLLGVQTKLSFTPLI